MSFESLKRTLVKSLTYRVVHFFIHLGETYIAISLFDSFGHLGPVLAVSFTQFICWAHYVGHERIFARLNWGYTSPTIPSNRELEEE